MALANSVKTHQQDPLYFNQQRCEFRLDKGKVFLSNLRLADIGMKVSNITNPRFPHSVGAYSMLRKISLLNDNVEIASLDNVSDYLAFANLQRTNANAYQMARRLNMSHLGYDLDARNGELTASLSGANTKRYDVTDFTNPQEDIPQASVSGGDPDEQGSLSLTTAIGVKKTTFNVTAGGTFTALPTCELDDAKGGADAVFTVQMNGGNTAVVSITCTVEGYGFTDIPTVKFVGGGMTVAPTMSALAVQRRITTDDVVTAGSGYRSTPSVTFNPALDGATVITSGVSTSNVSKIFTKDNTETGNVLTSSEDTTPRAWLDLKICFPYLKAIPYLDTEQLQSLRLVVEFQPSSASAIVGSAVKGQTPVYEYLRPSLIVDEVINLQGKVKNPTVKYVNMDSEKVVVNTNNNAVDQRLRGFDSKTINRILMVNKLPDQSDNLKGHCSPSMFQESYQFILNGKKFLPYQGIDSPAKKQQMLNDSWGGHLAPCATNQYVLDRVGDILQEPELARKFSYGGITLGAEIDELQLEYRRSTYLSVAKSIVSGTKSAGVGQNTILVVRNHGFKINDKIIIAGADAGLNDGSGAKVVKVVSDLDTIEVDKDTSAVAGLGIVTTSTIKGVNSDSHNVNSQVGFDMLFWGEVMKTMTVSDNKVSVSY